MQTSSMSSTLYSQEQIAPLLEELNEIKADRDRIWEEKEKLSRRIEAKDALIQSLDEENRQLKEYRASVRAIAAIPHTVAGPYSKLAMITQPDQVTYSAGKHGGDESIQLTSMKQWNMAIGGNEENTHCLARALEPLEATGTITRTKVECPDKRKHFSVAINQEHFRNPKLIKPAEERPHNGGDKRCPQCGGFCKKRIDITYECEKCGLDFDGAMNPRSHGTPIENPPPVPEASTVSQPLVIATPMDWNVIAADMPVKNIDAPTEETVTRGFGKGIMKGVWK